MNQTKSQNHIKHLKLLKYWLPSAPDRLIMASEEFLCRCYCDMLTIFLGPVLDEIDVDDIGIYKMGRLAILEKQRCYCGIFQDELSRDVEYLIGHQDRVI